MEFKSDIVIGLEVHCELNTKTKLFCGCPTKSKHGEGDLPNSRCCPTCLGMPGSKPVLNSKAVEFALKLCIGLSCKISSEIVFSRKSYFYPDLSKNYQITQYEIPLGKKGYIKIDQKQVGITRVHLEEDPASIVHPSGVRESAYVLVDYNRSGNPLAEIVTEPMMQSPHEAREFMRRIISVLNYLEIFDVRGGIIKADANVSIKESGYKRVEIKNITGFKDIEKALEYEIGRQRAQISQGKGIAIETRGYDSQKCSTYLLREKESEEDYGYIIDTDLAPVRISKKWIDDIKSKMPELPHDKIKRFVHYYRIKQDDAAIIASDRMLADIFENIAKEADPILTAKWLRGELMRVLNYNKKEVYEMGISYGHICDLIKLVESKKITDNVASKILEKLMEFPFDVKEYVKKENLGAVSDISELEKYCRDAIGKNPQAVEDYKKGEDKALNFIVGSVMRMTRGKATPKEVNDIIIRIIKEDN